MSREATSENGAVLGSKEYWDRVNRATFWGHLMRNASDTNYQETLHEVGKRAGEAIEEIYDDLQNNLKSVRAISSDRRNALAKQVQELYDVCRISGGFCRHSSDCIGILNLSSFYLSTPSFSDDRNIQNAIHKIKNCPDFFASECIDLIRKAADWSISFAAGSDARKSAFLKDVSQGKDRDFLRDVLDAYESSSGTVDLRGNCGYSIGSREYRDYMEREVFLQDAPSISSDDYSGAIRDSLVNIASQVRRDLDRNQRENNYITDETADNLREAINELERCGISTGISDSAISRLSWFVGGDANQISRLQSALNGLRIGDHLTEDGVYGEKTDTARAAFLDELMRGAFPTLTWVDPLQSSSTGIRAATKTLKDGRTFSRLISDESSKPLFRADLHPYKGNQAYYHINIDTLPDASEAQKNIAKRLDHAEISKEAYDVLKDFQHSARTVRIAGRVLLVTGGVLDALELCNTIDNDLHDADRKIGKKTYRSAAEIGGSWIGSALGAKGGAWTGAAIGTAILPGVGTAVGGIAGGLILGVVGSYAGSSLGKWVIDITEIGE